MLRNLRTTALLLAVAVRALAPAAATGDDVLFKNETDDVLFILAITGSGDCWTKYPPQPHLFPLNPGETEKVTAVGEKTVCWVASPHEDIKQFVLYCDEATAPDEVVLEDELPLCDLKPLSTNYSIPYDEGTISKTGDREEFKRRLGIWDDPLTPPQTRAQCVKWAKGHWPWCERWKTCIGHKYECRKLRNELFLFVSADLDPDTLRRRTEDCLKTAAVAAAVAGVIGAYTTGQGIPAAEAAFKAVFASCMTGVPDLQIKLDQRSHWTPWGSC